MHLLILLVLLPASSFNPSQPLELDSFKITSSFGEYRHRHFHAGFDYSTFGNTGVPVLALDNGVIFRVSFSPWSYGKNLWLLTQSGFIVRYVHLSRFSHRVDSLVYFYRQAHQCDTGTVEMAEKVHKGQVIAYSGETGAGPPHLHLEIYDSGGRLVNPWELGLRYPDPNPPVIRGISVVPRQASTRVEGLNWEVFYPQSSDTVRVQGAFGIMLWAHDVWGSYVGVRRARLWVDDSLVFQLDFDTMNPELRHWSDAVYAFQGGWNSKAPIRCFSLSPKQELLCCTALPQLELSPGLHKARVLVQDYPGHQAQMSFVIKVGQSKPSLHEPVFWDYQDDSVAFRSFEYGTLIRLSKAASGIEPVFQQEDRFYYWIGSDTSARLGALEITTKTLGPSGGSVQAMGLELSARPGALAGPVLFAVVEVQGHVGIFPRFPPCLEKCQLRWLEPKQGFLFRANSRFKAIRCIGPDTSALASRFGFILHAKDNLKPVIKPITTRPDLFAFKVYDKGTGVRKVSLFIDENWVPGDYDPEKSTYRFRPIYNILKGKHSWRIVAVDLADNQQELQGTLEVK